MPSLVNLFLIFLKIGAFSFGGGYAMLPFIQQEFIYNNHFISSKEFLDLLAISQSTPGPIAINSATFVGFKTHGFLGSLVSTLGVIVFALVGLTIISMYLSKFKNNERVNRLLLTLRPITLGFILAAGFSSGQAIAWTKSIYPILALVSSLALIYSKKLGTISIIFLYGTLGILIELFIK